MVTVDRVDRLEGAAADQLGRILVESFPADERDDPDTVVDNVATGRRQCYVATDGDAVVGFALLLPLAGTPATLLEYLAVDTRHRNNGLGGRLLDRVVLDAEAAHPRRAGVVLEVEPPGTSEGDERRLRERRIAFYERHGAHLVSGAPAYRVPGTVTPGTLPFLLMWRPLADSRPLAGIALRECVAAILFEGYELDEDSPLVVEVLAGLTS